ncbi:aspartate:alanine exchanger family transporter [Arcanobacterium canis]
MIELLSAQPLLTVFLVVTLGALLGMIPFGPLKLGAAGALFVGLLVGNFVPEMGKTLGLVQSLGLGLFVYMVGISAGQTFFSDLRRQAKFIFSSVLVLGVGGAVVVFLGNILGLSRDLGIGIFAGAMTTTPALAAATDAATNKDAPGVGYALGYPMGVIVAIILVSIVVGRKWGEKNDIPSRSGDHLSAVTAIVHRPMPVREVPGWKEQQVRLSYLRRGDSVRVISPGEEFIEGDRVVVVGMADDVDVAVDALGEVVPSHLADDRSTVDFRQFLVSNDDLAGRSVVELNVGGRFGGVITRIHRGDIEMLAADDMNLELGDRVLVAFPRREFDALSSFFGNSVRRISEVDAIPMGLGMVLGLLLGMVQFTLPGGSSFSLGAAAGPLVVGMILGYLQRTGPIVWQPPMAANLTIRQLGLLLFLAAVGIASGPAFAKTAFTPQGLRGGLLGLAVAVIVLALTAMMGKILGLSAQRTAGAMAGILGQPAILAYAQGKVNDERIESGYAALFAFGIIVKIILVYLLVAI